MVVHKGCKISLVQHGSVNGFVWEELLYGAESDDVFQTIEEAKADIDQFFGNGRVPREINGEIYV